MVTLTKTALYFSDLDTILGDVLEICSVFNFISFTHVKRDENIVAHNLVRVVPFGEEQCWENHVPCDVLYLHTYTWTLCPLINTLLFSPQKKKKPRLVNSFGAGRNCEMHFISFLSFPSQI